MIHQKTLLLLATATSVTLCYSLPQFAAKHVNDASGDQQVNQHTHRSRSGSISQPVIAEANEASPASDANVGVPCKTRGENHQHAPTASTASTAAGALPHGTADVFGFPGSYYGYPWQVNIQQPMVYHTDNFRTQPSYQVQANQELYNQEPSQQSEHYLIQREPIRRRIIPGLEHFLPNYHQHTAYPIRNQYADTGSEDQFRFALPGDYAYNNQEGTSRPMPGFLVPGYQAPYNLFDQWASSNAPSYLVHYPADPNQEGSVLIFDQDELQEGRPVGGGHNSITKLCRIIGGHKLGKICKKVTRPILG